MSRDIEEALAFYSNPENLRAAQTRTYCECPSGPAPYHTAGKCGRCFRPIEPEPNYCPACEGEGRTFVVDGQHCTFNDCERCGGTGEVARAA